jgi:hypothetical protein
VDEDAARIQGSESGVTDYFNDFPARYAMNRPDLDDLALSYGTDKSSAGHGYTKWYRQHLEHMRDEPLTLLELGVGGHEDPAKGGASLRMWRQYLPNARGIVGLDLEKKDFFIDGVVIYQGSQADPEIIEHVGLAEGPFDVIVDDASHVSSLTIKSFKLLYPHLNPGGLYVVEDLHSSYQSFYYTPAEASGNPDNTRVNTAMGFFKRMADEVNFDPAGPGMLPCTKRWNLFPPEYWMGFHLESVSFYKDCVFIVKHPDA